MMLLDLEDLVTIDDEIFISSLINEREEEYKIFGILQSGKNKIESLRNVIENMLKFTNEINIKFHCLVSLGDYKNSNSIDLIISFLNDEKQYIRRAAVEALGKIQDDRIIEPLKNLYFKENDFVDRMAIITSIFKIKNKSEANKTLKFFRKSEENLILKTFLDEKIEKPR